MTSDEEGDITFVKPAKGVTVFVILIKSFISLAALFVAMWAMGLSGQSYVSNLLGFLGLEMSILTFYLYLLGLFVLGVSLIISVVMLRLQNVGADLGDDSITVVKTQFLLFLTKIKIPYDNLIRVSVESADIFDKLFNTGDIVFDLSAMATKQERVESVSDPLKSAKIIQDKLYEFRNRKQAVYDEKNKIEDVFDREGF